SPVTWLELAAFVLSLWMVGCNMRVHWFGWPLAIASSAMYALLFLASRLYGEAGLQVFFAVVALWGWWQWLRGTQADGKPLEVRELGARGRAVAIALLVVAWPATGLFLRHYTDTDVPWWDAFPTAASVLGQWLLGRKYVENWPTWIVVNVVSIALFAYKELWLTMLLYTIFVAMSFAGWRAWARLAPAPR
ncbi:MAG TPA: nicotinamide riboside transporter PnuC, partial [Albitalea sp.]|nr:nicotinamide riboside transporter PnuC [Albitalea sp.]